MAISKMQKLSLVAREEDLPHLTKLLQELQAVEIIDSKQEEEFAPIFERYFDEELQVNSLEILEDKMNEVEEKLSSVQTAITFIQRNGKLKSKEVGLKRVSLSLAELEAQVNLNEIHQLLEEIATLEQKRQRLEQECDELQEKENTIGVWRTLDIDPKKAKTLQYVNANVATVDAMLFDEMQQSLSTKLSHYELEVIRLGKQENSFVLFTLKEEESVAKEILQQVGVQEFSYKEDGVPTLVYEILERTRLDRSNELQELYKQVHQYAKALPDLFKYEELLLAKVARIEAETMMLTTGHVTYMEGFLPLEKQEAFYTQLDPLVKAKRVWIEVFDELPKEIEKIPVLLKNGRFVRPFEKLTEMYALPKYDEIDPTPFMMPFYFVFFGMMVADIGYGLVLFLATMIAKKVMVFPRGMKQFIDFFQIVAIPTILWGFIYSSFFGAALPKSLFGISLPFPIISTTEDVNTILIVSLALGFIQILTGLALSSALHIRKKDYLQSVADGFAWQGILIGAVLAVLGAVALHLPILVTIGAVLAGVSAFSILLVPMLKTKNKVTGFATGLYNLYGISGYIGDLVSYTRLMALGISGGSIAAAFNLLVGFMPPVMRFTIGILLLILLQSLNLFLSYLSAYVHSARLQYVEFFGKFYNGGGRAFSPLKPKEKHVNISQKEK
ncbi:V/A-type H+-transporting ATPase subunit I [Pilibacter termitis]|uniref:V/A-type H+-transporting ATPase subunit I n=1 Tax=Pilibacter termitis TaxID=263852 RepID=A0A1T4K4Y0_9ENTE|nr:V-type ATP synthase subunit I [Pilibacter termitis]SJZ37375.1 V/A-type H+-transporting ATPase subunit I [Pilibacter termitis]